MHIIKLILFGALGALGLLRGAELILTGNLSAALIPALLGVVFTVAFFQERKKK